MASLPVNFPWALGSDPTSPIDITATEADVTPRLAQYIRGKPNMEALLDALGEQAAALAAMFSDLDILRRIDNAFGSQLDVLGDIVGAPRSGLDDDTYRGLIKATIKLNNASGTAEEILEI